MAFASRTPNRSSSWDTTGPQRVEPSHTRWSCSRADAAAPQHSQASPPALPLATVIVSMARFPTPRRPYSRTLIEACTSLIFRTSLISRPKSSVVSPGPAQQVPAGAQRPAQTPSYSAPKQASRSRCSTTNIVADGSDKSGEASADYGSYRSRPWTRPGSPAVPDRLIDRVRTPARKQPTQPDSPTGAASTQNVPEASRRAGTGIRSGRNHRCAVCV